MILTDKSLDSFAKNVFRCIPFKHNYISISCSHIVRCITDMFLFAFYSYNCVDAHLTDFSYYLFLTGMSLIAFLADMSLKVFIFDTFLCILCYNNFRCILYGRIFSFISFKRICLSIAFTHIFEWVHAFIISTFIYRLKQD